MVKVKLHKGTACMKIKSVEVLTRGKQQQPPTKRKEKKKKKKKEEKKKKKKKKKRKKEKKKDHHCQRDQNPTLYMATN